MGGSFFAERFPPCDARLNISKGASSPLPAESLHFPSRRKAFSRHDAPRWRFLCISQQRPLPRSDPRPQTAPPSARRGANGRRPPFSLPRARARGRSDHPQRRPRESNHAPRGMPSCAAPPTRHPGAAAALVRPVVDAVQALRQHRRQHQTRTKKRDVRICRPYAHVIGEVDVPG